MTLADWKIIGDAAVVHIEAPVNIRAVIELPDVDSVAVGSGSHDGLAYRKNARLGCLCEEAACEKKEREKARAQSGQGGSHAF